MSDPFVGQIQMAGFNFAPRGYAECDGQIMPINQNTALFSLLGTTYGGNGVTTFALPNLQGRAPMHTGGGQGPGLSPHSLGEQSGTETVSLIDPQMPAHNHMLFGQTAASTQVDPGGELYSMTASPGRMYNPGGTLVPMAPQALAPTGGNQPHNNMQPFLVINFFIALQGIYPSRN